MYSAVPNGAPKTWRPCCSGGRAQSPTQMVVGGALEGWRFRRPAGSSPAEFQILVFAGLSWTRAWSQRAALMSAYS